MLVECGVQLKSVAWLRPLFGKTILTIRCFIR